MLIIPRNGLLCWLVAVISFSMGGSGQQKASAEEEVRSGFGEKFSLGRRAEWLGADLALEVVVDDDNVSWVSEWLTDGNIALSESGSTVISIGSDAKFLAGNILSFDMKLRYSVLSKRELAASLMDQTGVSDSSSYWR